MGKRLYVGGLPWAATEQQLTEVFGAHGTVVSATILSDKMTGKSKGFGFVEMSTDEEAQAAISALHDDERAFGRRLTVNEARPREERPKRDWDSNSGGGNW
jgi:RNA recognition motif-containing protein